MDLAKSFLHLAEQFPKVVFSWFDLGETLQRGSFDHFKKKLGFEPKFRGLLGSNFKFHVMLGNYVSK